MLAAVSGGPDSVALACGLSELKRLTGGAGKLILAHVNHQLRAAESDRQEAWVAAFAERLGLPLLVETRTVADRAALDGDGIEAAARAERYAALAKLADETGARYVATGHTRNDQVETVAMRLLRGASLRGLGGMRSARPLTAGAALIRPLLGVSREEICSFLAELGQDSFHDQSNDDRRFTRNRVRHDILPPLRAACDGDLDAALAELAADAQAAFDIVKTAAQSALQACRISGSIGSNSAEVGFRVDTENLGKHPPLLQTEALRGAWREASLGEQAMTRRHWRTLAAMIGDVEAAAINLPGNVRARREGATLVVERLGPA